jgi:stringent starvation protein B
MSKPLSPESQGTSTRPYLIRALHDWCTDNGFTPYLAVFVDETVQVPMEYVKNREIVLNVSFEATSGLQIGNDFVEFKARFGGVPREIVVPVDHVVAIYARENGQGMAFPVPPDASAAQPATASEAVAAPEPAPAPGPRGAAVFTLAGEKVEPPAPAAPRRARAASASRAVRPPDAPPPAPAPAPAPRGGGRPSLKRVK